MFDYVMDTNILMSMLISGKASYKPIVMFHRLVSVDYVFSEIEEYRSIIFQKTKFDTPQLIDYTNQILSKITILPRYVISDDNLKKATDLTKNIDFNDVWFVALALEYNLPLLTRDTKLHEGLQKKGFKNCILFDQFLRSLTQ